MSVGYLPASRLMLVLYAPAAARCRAVCEPARGGGTPSLCLGEQAGDKMAPVEKKEEGEKAGKKAAYVPTGKPRGRPKGSVSKKNKPYTGKPRGRPKATKE